MEGRRMNMAGSDVDREFFLTGAKTYLDVKDALAEFQTRVRHACDAVVMDLLNDINCACCLNLSRSDFKDYIWNASSDEVHIGRKALLKTLGPSEGGLYLGLVLRRQNQRRFCEARVFLYRDNDSFVPSFWDKLSGTSTPSFYRKGKLDCGVDKELSDDEIANIQETIAQVTAALLACITSAGGIKP
jgi:hypothetical protein